MQYLLVTDGTSDEILQFPLNWLLDRYMGDETYEAQWTFLGHGVESRIRKALDRYSFDLLFVHRDAERQDDFERRYQEIDDAVAKIGLTIPYICVVPVRMTEAWFLFDEQAIVKAANNPGANIALPKRRDWEKFHAKEVLKGLLQGASPRKQPFSDGEMVRRTAARIEDFSPLQTIDSFKQLEKDIRETVKTQRWVNED